jgi:CheY-like chemotaxis protein
MSNCIAADVLPHYRSVEIGAAARAHHWLPAAESEPVTSPHDTLTNTADKTAKLTILLVDDDALIAMSTVMMLEDLGHEVIEANSGESALAILSNNPSIDLLITDYAMPKMNGAELAKAARKIRSNLPILLATGYAASPEGEGIELPRIGKPYLQAELATEISKLVNA